MANWITHIRIADILISKGIDVDIRGFVIGNIAPDCNVENEDWSGYIPSRETTHFMDKINDKTTSDYEGFFNEYIKNKPFKSKEEYSFLLGYYCHLITDAKYALFIRDENRVSASFNRIKANPEMNKKIQGFLESFDTLKKIFGKWNVFSDIVELENKYITDNPDCSYNQILRKTKNFPDYLDFFPKNAINRKIPIMIKEYDDIKAMKGSGYYFFSVDEYENYLQDTADFIYNMYQDKINMRLKQIRESERISHTKAYLNNELYNSKGWLQKPIKTVQELINNFDDYNDFRVLDLGCGIGRNSLYIAEKFKAKNCTIDCVDILDIAIEKLNQYAEQLNVTKQIKGINESIEEFKIENESYDLIMAISALEHVNTENTFIAILNSIEKGLRKNGIACFVINSNVTETNLKTHENIEAKFEVNLSTKTIQNYLRTIFNGWDILKSTIVEQEYDIPREDYTSRLCTNVITFVIKKV